jgi:hypothetical protein
MQQCGAILLASLALRCAHALTGARGIRKGGIRNDRGVTGGRSPAVVRRPMQLAFTDGRLISTLTELQSAVPVGSAPVEFSAQVSTEGAEILRAGPSPFYRATDGDERFTLTIDRVTGLRIAGTIRRR